MFYGLILEVLTPEERAELEKRDPAADQGDVRAHRPPPVRADHAGPAPHGLIQSAPLARISEARSALLIVMTDISAATRTGAAAPTTSSSPHAVFRRLFSLLPSAVRATEAHDRRRARTLVLAHRHGHRRTAPPSRHRGRDAVGHARDPRAGVRAARAPDAGAARPHRRAARLGRANSRAGGASRRIRTCAIASLRDSTRSTSALRLHLKDEEAQDPPGGADRDVAAGMG